MRCTATSKRTGLQCNGRAVTGKTKCRMHGGSTPSGIASENFRTGKYSKHLPSRLIAAYQETIADPKLWELNEKAGLIDARLVELVQRLDTGESGETWAALKKAWADLKAAINAGDAEETALFMPVVDDLITAGNRDQAVWKEISELINTYKGLSESERRHNENMERMITAEQMMLMFAAVTDLVRQNVTDRHALHAISAGIEKLITVNHDS